MGDTTEGGVGEKTKSREVSGDHAAGGKRSRKIVEIRASTGAGGEKLNLWWVGGRRRGR